MNDDSDSLQDHCSNRFVNNSNNLNMLNRNYDDDVNDYDDENDVDGVDDDDHRRWKKYLDHE